MSDGSGRGPVSPGTPGAGAALPAPGAGVGGRDAGVAGPAALLALWAAALALAGWRWGRVTETLRGAGSLDDRVALATLAALAVGLPAWLLLSRRRRTATAERTGQWALVFRVFRRNRLAVAGLGVIVVLYLVALLTPYLAPYDPTLQGDLLEERLLAPSAAHPLGTDRFARDVLSRLLFGARISLSIGFIAVGISVTLGTLLGAVAGYVGGKVDTVIMRFVDMVLSFPRLVLLITIIAVFEPSIFLIVIVLGLTQWPGTTRIVRGEVLSLRERDFVHAARALGLSRTRIVLRHLIPNALAPVIVAATLGIGNTIVLEAGLSFLGMGVQPPTPSWGTMVATGRNNLVDAWWISTFSGLAIVVTVLAFNLVGDGLRDALDPRLRT